MLTLLPILNSTFFIECNTESFKTYGASVVPLKDLDDLFAMYCNIDFISEV